MYKLDIIYQDEYLVAINKPHGLLVHRSSIANDATEFALRLLLDQLNQKYSQCTGLTVKLAACFYLH